MTDHVIPAAMRLLKDGRRYGVGCGRPVPAAHHGICSYDLGIVWFSDEFHEWVMWVERDYRKRADGLYELREHPRQPNRPRALPMTIICPSCRFRNVVLPPGEHFTS